MNTTQVKLNELLDCLKVDLFNCENIRFSQLNYKHFLYEHEERNFCYGGIVKSLFQIEINPVNIFVINTEEYEYDICRKKYVYHAHSGLVNLSSTVFPNFIDFLINNKLDDFVVMFVVKNRKNSNSTVIMKLLNGIDGNEIYFKSYIYNFKETQ